jgi:hypothetical protein
MTTSRLLKEVKDGGPILRSPAETTEISATLFFATANLQTNSQVRWPAPAPQLVIASEGSRSLASRAPPLGPARVCRYAVLSAPVCVSIFSASMCE